MTSNDELNVESKPKVLVVDDDSTIRRQLKWGLSDEFDVIAADNPRDGFEQARQNRPDVVALDLALERDDPETGFELLDRFVSFDPLLKVVMVTGQDAKENALRAVDQGAFDFFTKPIDLDELRVLIRRAISVRKLELENASLREKLRREGSLGRILGQSSEIQAVFRMIRRVAPTDVTVLMTGQSGTGKDLVAREVHRLSSRAENPFITVSCGVLPEPALEVELFGPPQNEKGAALKGRLRAAHGGTVFLDEIDQIPAGLQAKLVQFLEQQDRDYSGGGSGLDVRILASSSIDLRDRVAGGVFRDDLFFRLSVVSIHLPPLKDRKEDIPYLAHRFLDRYGSELGRGHLTFSREALRALQRFPWPGNVRELEHRVQRGIVMARGRVIRPEDLELESDDQTSIMTLRSAREWGERRVVVEALRRNCGNIARAARELEVSRPTLHDLLRKLEIRAGDYKKGLGPSEEDAKRASQPL
jgi:two-component system NtrC family response regulator